VRVSTDSANAVLSGPSGTYNLWLQAGTHNVAFEKYGFADQIITVNASGGMITRNITMAVGSPAQVVFTTGNGVPQGNIPISITKIPLDTVTDANGNVTINAFAGRYSVTYGTLPWSTSTVVLNIPAGNSNSQLTLSRSPRALPTGPDSAGYYIYDNYDAPAAAFDWVEINPSVGGLPGTQLAVGADNSVTVTLPFTFVFYQSSFATISVSANGFIVPGNYSPDPNDWARAPIPSTLPPNGILAPWWEDLEPQNGDGVWYYSQPDSHRVIVEWSNDPLNTIFGNGRITCEAVLYDNGNVKFQYDSLQMGRFESSVGIENPTGTDGLQYVFQLQYDAHASPIVAGRSLLITTDSTLKSNPPVMHGVPREFTFSQNYPNPFNPTTTFSWSVPRASAIRLALYDVLGREAAVVFDGTCQAGEHTQNFDASRLATGVYFARLETRGHAIMTRKVLLLK